MVLLEFEQSIVAKLVEKQPASTVASFVDAPGVLD